MVLVIFAHPLDDGHCNAILREVKKELEASGKEYEVLDLYGMKYDPVLREDELYTHGGKPSKETLELQEKIKAADRLIFVYPIWWNSMPAILKGFLDRTLTPGFAYKFSPRGIPIKYLKGKRAVLFITTGSSKPAFTLFLGRRGEKIMVKDILGFCGIKAKAFQLANARKMDNATGARIEKLVKKGLKHLLG